MQLTWLLSKRLPEEVWLRKRPKFLIWNMSSIGRPPKPSGMTGNNWSRTRDSSIRSVARVPANAFAIWAREDAIAPNVIAGTLSPFNYNVYAMINPGSIHSYICTTLVLNKNILIDSTEFIVKVTNSLGEHVLVNKVCRNCPLKIQDCDFPIDLMLLPFHEFDVILDMDWLTLRTR